MADEISLTYALDYKLGSVLESIDKATHAITQTGTIMVHNVQEIAYSVEEALYQGDIANLGYCIIVNRGAAGYLVQLRGAAEEANAIVLRPGEVNMFRFDPAATPTVLQSTPTTGTTDIEYWLFEA